MTVTRQEAFPRGGALEQREQWLRRYLLERKRRRAARPLAYDVPFPWQEPFQAAVAKEQVGLAGNRPGKTHMAARKIVRTLEGDHPWWKGPPAVIWCATESFDDSCKITRKAIRKLIRPELVASWTGEKDKKAHSTLITTTGWVVEFKAYSQTRRMFQGESVALVWFDEEPPEDIYAEGYTRTVDCAGRVLCTFTPLNGLKNKGLYDRWYKPWLRFKGKHPDAKSGLVRPGVHITTGGMADNPRIPTEEIELFMQTWSHRPLMIRVRVFGEWMDMSEEAIVPADRIIRDATPGIVPEQWSEIRGWIDSNFGEGKSGCEFCISIGGRDQQSPEPHLWLLEQRGGPIDSHEKLELSVDVLRRWSCPPTNVQDTGIDREFAHRLNKALSDTPGCVPCVRPYRPSDPDDGHPLQIPSKEARAESFAIVVARRIVHIHPEMDDFISEVGTFPAGSGDDWLDSGMGVLMRLHERSGRAGDHFSWGSLPSTRRTPDDFDDADTSGRPWAYDVDDDGELDADDLDVGSDAFD